jgi:hypothetical protein
MDRAPQVKSLQTIHLNNNKTIPSSSGICLPSILVRPYSSYTFKEEEHLHKLRHTTATKKHLGREYDSCQKKTLPHYNSLITVYIGQVTDEWYMPRVKSYKI